MKLSFRTFGYLGYGIYHDIKARLPYYASDFKDAWNYRVIPSTTFIFFTNLLPAIAFAQDMFDKTDRSYGLNEVLLSSAMGGVVFGLFSGQPLCIVGVTGPIAIFSYTVYQLMEPRGTPYFPFMCWVYLWSMVFHLAIAITNLVSFLKIISTFSCDVFGFFICIVYIQKGIQILSRQFADVGLASGYCSVMIAILMAIFGVGSGVFGTQTHYFRPWTRKMFVDYGVCLAVIFFTGFVHFGGALDSTDLARLPVTKSFAPTHSGADRQHGWFVHFWPPHNISVGDMFLAIPFAVLLTFLFYFDHNVSSLMCQSKEYPLRKPSSFHWDFALLGITTGVAGLLGIPPPNGLIPQAPLHSDSLVVHNRAGQAVSVVEQRVSNTVQGLVTIVMMSRPFLVVLGLIPQAVLAGLFFVMGISGLDGNIITNRIRYVFMDREYIESDASCPAVFKTIHASHPNRWYYVYLVLQIGAAMCEFAITCTKGAVGFPGVLLFFAACARWVWPRIIPAAELEQLDGEVADEMIIKSLRVVAEARRGSEDEKSEQVHSSDYEVGPP